jgi:lipopolysaccharide export system ATP-binding protein
MTTKSPTTPAKAEPSKVRTSAQPLAPKVELPKTESPNSPVAAQPQAPKAELPKAEAPVAPPASHAKTEPRVIELPPKGLLGSGLPGSALPGTGPRLVTANSGLVASHLGKQFKRRPVLRDVTVSVQRGEAVGLLGPNGAGKTTCFYIITGLINADTGTIEMDGTDITHLPMYRRARMGIGYLPQEASIFRGLTVEENIRAVLEVVEPERDMREAMLDDLLAEFSISHLRRTPALALSGGERRRVEIARALASRPQFMLLDEPLAGIDPIAIGEIRELISHLRKRGIGVLITDHNVRETLDIVDRAYILHDGTVLMDGRPSEIVAHQDVRRVYLGERFSL